MVHARDTISNPTEQWPSLIRCLETEGLGFYLDIELPDRYRYIEKDGTLCHSPFSRTVKARIKTDGQDGVRDVLLVLQRDRYDWSDALVAINNTDVDTAWQNTFAFHNRAGHAGEAFYFKHQIDPIGQLLPFQSLFLCLESKRWFHPVCPQCGLGLTLCRDDAFLRNKGVPAYTDSLERFLFCPACSTRSDATPLYASEKTAGMPDFVLDAADLVAQWQERIDQSKTAPELPCQGCASFERCYGSAAPGPARIVPFSFYPFYMTMVPAPACDATTFMRMLSGGSAATPQKLQTASAASGQDPFLFQDKRRFLEILYLKLTFLDQVIGQFIPENGPEVVPDVGLSLDGIGVDLHPPGTGLPVYWNFSARILDAIGSINRSPFAPAIPEAPSCHFLGAVWFRVLLVNDSQDSATVYAAVGRLVNRLPDVSQLSPEDLDLSDPASVFTANNLFYEPHRHAVVQEWQDVWLPAIRLGLQLVHAGVKTGTSWNREAFMDSLGNLRHRIKNSMFAASGVQPVAKAPKQTERIRGLLGTILDKWQRAADIAGRQAPPATAPQIPDTGIDDPDATVIIDPGKQAPATMPASMDATIVTGENGSSEDDIMEQTIIIQSSLKNEK